MVSLRNGRNPQTARASVDLSSLRQELLSDSEELAELPAGGGLDLDGVRRVESRSDRSVRPLRSGPLRELLDAEFQRCHRFETISSFFGDLRSLLKKAVTREEDDDLEVEQYQRSERRLT